MEFYQKWHTFRLPRFPVSIPNGMEFYSFRGDITTIYTSFNSQRDGILPEREKREAAIQK